MVFYGAKNLYDVPRVHTPTFILPSLLFSNIEHLTGNAIHVPTYPQHENQLPGMTDIEILKVNLQSVARGT